MATSNFQTQQSCHVLITISLTFFLLLNRVNSSESLSFSFTKFLPNQKTLLLQGDALVTQTGKLQLTTVQANDRPVQNSLGRALYSAPVHIWDSSTGNVASFVTSFSFLIKAPVDGSNTPADGIAFFLAPPDTQPQQRAGYLGLFRDDSSNSSYQIVAVEFDTFSNAWDPSVLHIGIDVNSIRSIVTAPWGFVNGEVADVFISYQASTKALVASIVYPSRSTSYFAYATVDLTSILPDWVRVGFSATTGLYSNFVETHDVLSWSFASTLPDCKGSTLENNAHPAN